MIAAPFMSQRVISCWLLQVLAEWNMVVGMTSQSSPLHMKDVMTTLPM